MNHPSPFPSRRSLLGMLAGGLGLTATATAERALKASRASARSTNSLPASWALDAVNTAVSFGDGATIPFFEFMSIGGGQTRGLHPYAEATEGDTMTVSVSNSLKVTIRPTILGVARGPWIRPGKSGSFSFTMPPAGTYLLSTDQGPTGTHTAGHGAQAATRPATGLGGTLVSRPASGNQVLYDGGPSFDREYVLLFDDADDRWSAVQNDPRALPLTPYEANYFRVNGLAFPDTFADADTVVAANLGERVLLRLGNLGMTRQSIHMHGYHFDVATRDGAPEHFLGRKDTIQVAHRSTTDIIATVNQTGMFPFHPHNVQAVTANGLYPFGQLVLITVS